MAEYIERAKAKEELLSWARCIKHPEHIMTEDSMCVLDSIPAVDVTEVVHGYHEGDVCIYGFGHKNKSRAIVEIVRILNDERGVAEIKFHKVFVDDTGNGFFDYLLKIGGTMNASLKYLKNITPRMDGDG